MIVPVCSSARTTRQIASRPNIQGVGKPPNGIEFVMPFFERHAIAASNAMRSAELTVREMVPGQHAAIPTQEQSVLEVFSTKQHVKLSRVDEVHFYDGVVGDCITDRYCSGFRCEKLVPPVEIPLG